MPVAHSIYGVAGTINAANYVFFLALEKVQRLDHVQVKYGLLDKIKKMYRRISLRITDM